MSDTQVPGEGTPDATPTEALELADQQPVTPEPAAAAPAATAPAAAAPATNHTRTILEVIGGVVAAGLIVVAGVLGFAVGHATGDDDGRLNLSNSGRELRDGPAAGGQGQGRDQQMPGQGQPGQGQQGPGQQMPGQPGMPGEQGFGGHGDRDGDGFGGRGGHDGDMDGDMDGGRAPGDVEQFDMNGEPSDDLESATPAPTTQG
jgi:hypothetical protein